MPSLVALSVLCTLISGCASTVIETATDTALGVAKVPFKAGSAVIDVVTDDD